MDHIPMYRARAQRTPAPAFPLRRSASIVSAAAALTLSGIALGYHGLGDMSPAFEQAAQTTNTEIAIPVPKITFPTVTSGHPDVLAQLSTALLARLPIAPRSVAALPPPPPPPATFVAPTLEPFVLSVDVAPAADVTTANLDVPDDATVVARAPRVVSTPVQLAARSVAAPVQVEVAGVTAEAEPTLEAASVATPEPTSPPQPKPAPAIARRAPTPTPAPAPKLPAKAPPLERLQPLQHKDPPPETHPKPQANADSGKKQEDPKPQPHAESQSHPAHDSKPSPGDKGNGHGG